jgi:hypothetical protein
MESNRRDDGATPYSVPGAQDSAILALDALLTLLRIGKAEALQALATLPHLLGMNLYRLPVLLLTWISFGVLVACSVYTATSSLVLAAGSFFLLQLGLTLLLERRYRRLHSRVEFLETRRSVAALQASLAERFGHETE